MSTESLARGCPLVRRVLGHRMALMLTLCVVLAQAFSPLDEPASAAGENISFNIPQAVSSEDAAYIREGIALAQRYVTETLTDISETPIYIAAFDNDDFICGEALACTIPGSIAVLTGTPDWNSQAPFERVETMVHEYIHIYQFEILGDDMEMLPAWFIEGMAEYLGYDAVMREGLVLEGDVRDYHAWSVASSTNRPALEDLEDDDALAEEGFSGYGLAYLAIDELLGQRPVWDLYRFLNQVRHSHEWQNSFIRIFGQDIDAFYRAFDQTRDNLDASIFPPDPFALITPQFVERPLVIDSVTGPYAIGEQMTVLGKSRASAVCRLRLQSERSGEEESRTTFADGSGRLFWLITIPETFGEGPATITAACGGKTTSLDLEITA